MCAWEQLGSVVMVLGSQPTSCEFDSHPALVVVTLSKSLYPHCSSVPDWGGKKGKNISPIDSAKKNVVWLRLDFGCQHHPRGHC